MTKSKVILLVVALLALVGGVVWYQTTSSSKLLPPGTPSVSDKEPGSSAIVVEGGNAVNVESQQGGDTIAIDLAVLEKPGFVVIHKATKENTPGEIVGHSEILAKGQSKDIVIEVDPVAVKGDSYFAMLHEDTDRDEDFSSAEDDLPVKDDKGNIIMMKFTITADAPPSQED